jgi:hypothetical protein
MRLSKEPDGWHADGVRRRDYRHDYGTPEVPKGHPKRRQKKPRPPKHKHVWVEQAPYDYSYYSDQPKDRPHYYTRFMCTVCGKYESKVNPRYGYEYYRWAKNNGLAHYTFERG